MCSRFVSNFLAHSWFPIWLFPFLGMPLWILCILAKLFHSCPTFCNPMDYSPPGSSVHGILQARILEWVATLFSRGSSQPRDWNQLSCFSCIGRWILYHQRHLGSPFQSSQFSSVAQSCRSLCDPWTAARQASFSITNSRSLLKLMSIELVMPPNHLILCHPILFPP